MIPVPRDTRLGVRGERARRAGVIALYALVVAAALGEALRALGRVEGVIFSGYVQVGEAVLRGTDPYAVGGAAWQNTWPPFFLFVAAPLALGARVSLPLTLLLWQVLELVLMWGVIVLSVRPLVGDAERITFFPRAEGGLAFTSAALFVPFVLSARVFQEHAQHTQINVQVLFLALLAFAWFRRGRAAWGGLALAAAASVKATPLLLLGYLVYKRAWRESLWTAAWLVALNVALPVAVFGAAGAAAHWASWRSLAGAALADPTPTWMNQSLLAALKRLLTSAGGARDPFRYAVADWTPGAVRALFFAVAALAAGGLAWLFRGAPRRFDGARGAGELALALVAMVVVDPLAWKAHYVALAPAYAFAWWARERAPAGSGARRVWDAGLGASFACVSLSAPFLWGRAAAKALETGNAILVGALILAGLAAWGLAGRERGGGAPAF